MSAQNNRDVAVNFIERMKYCRGIDEALITDDFRWWTPAAGWRDKNEMRALIATLDSLMPYMPEMTILSTTAEGDRVAVEASGRCELTNGRRYENTYHFLITVRNRKVCAIREHNDTQRANDAFAP